jgi:hypothetical protein
VGVVVAALVAAYGALVLGEYEMAHGVTPLFSGALFGLAVAEVLVVVGRSPAPATAAAGGFLAFGGMTLAVVLSTSREVRFAGPEAWIGVAIATAVAWVWIRSAARLGRRSRRGT